MTNVVGLHPRGMALLLVGLLLISAFMTVVQHPTATASSHGSRLTVTLELSDGDIDYPVELNALHFFDTDDVPFLVQVVDGCGVNGRFWVFAAGLTDAPITMTVFDDLTGIVHTMVMPSYAPGAPIQAVFDADALAACGDQVRGGLPELTGSAVYTSANDRCQDASTGFRLQSNGKTDAYRTYVRRAGDEQRVIRENPPTVLADAGGREQLHLMVEGRTPRRIEGVVFGGGDGMIPSRNKLDKGLDGLTRGRVRRAFEAAKNERIPQPLIQDLGLKRVDCVYHVSLDFDTPGASVHLDTAGWLEDGGTLPAPLPLVEPRFRASVVDSAGSSVDIPLVAPDAGSDGDGRLWRYQDEETLVQIVDGCQLSGAFWTFSTTTHPEATELVVTDNIDGESVSYGLEANGNGASELIDTSTLRACR